MLKLTTRGIRTAEAIRNRVPFITSGALRATTDAPILVAPGYWCDHRLNETEWQRYMTVREAITYVVWSYDTPIAYYVARDVIRAVHVPGSLCGWHRVGQKFSLTTTKHQGNLYLV